MCYYLTIQIQYYRYKHVFRMMILCSTCVTNRVPYVFDIVKEADSSVHLARARSPNVPQLQRISDLLDQLVARIHPCWNWSCLQTGSDSAAGESSSASNQRHQHFHREWNFRQMGV